MDFRPTQLKIQGGKGAGNNNNNNKNKLKTWLYRNVRKLNAKMKTTHQYFDYRHPSAGWCRDTNFNSNSFSSLYMHSSTNYIFNFLPTINIEARKMYANGRETMRFISLKSKVDLLILSEQIRYPFGRKMDFFLSIFPKQIVFQDADKD